MAEVRQVLEGSHPPASCASVPRIRHRAGRGMV